MVKSPIILALDTKDLDTAKSWISATNNSISIYKVGLEFFLKFGAAGLQELRSHGDFEVFLDLKLHDIPNTVAGAVASVRDLSPKFLTVHASGGGEMIRAARIALSNSPNLQQETVRDLLFAHHLRRDQFAKRLMQVLR